MSWGEGIGCGGGKCCSVGGWEGCVGCGGGIMVFTAFSTALLIDSLNWVASDAIADDTADATKSPTRFSILLIASSI